MKIDKAKHAPGTVLLLEQGGRVDVAAIYSWSPMGQAVILQIGQTQAWFAAAKVCVLEFLRIVGWDEFKQMMDEAEKGRQASTQQAEEVQGEKSGS